jgi:LysM repeat protein
MTVTGQTQRPLPSDGDPAARQSRRRDATAVHEVCPYLAVEDASWRSAYAAREHRCQAVTPPAPLTVDKQRQLCLQPAHESCATFLAARAVAAESNPPGPGDDGASLWSASGSAPLVLEPARRMGAIPTPSGRSGGQALLIGLMVLAFIVLVIARTQSPAGSADPSGVPGGGAVAGVASTTPTASPAATSSAQGSPTPRPSPESTALPSATPAGTPAPSAAAAQRRYRVKSGDTMSSIAARYDTTVKKLAALNKISDPRVLRVGQVLLIP